MVKGTIKSFWTKTLIYILGVSLVLTFVPVSNTEAQAVRAPSMIAKSHYQLGNQYLRAGLSSKALVEFRKAANSDADYFQAQVQTARLYLKLKKYKEAASYYQRAAKIESNRPDLHMILGDLYTKLGKTPEANTHYSTSLSIDPNQPRAVVALAKFALKNKNYRETLELLQSHDSLRADEDAVAMRAFAAHQLGELELATELYHQAIKLNPSDGELSLNLGILEASRGNQVEALDAFERAALRVKDRARA